MMYDNNELAQLESRLDAAISDDDSPGLSANEIDRLFALRRAAKADQPVENDKPVRGVERLALALARAKD